MMSNEPLEDLVHWRGEPARLVRAIRQRAVTGTVTFSRVHAAAAAEKAVAGLAYPGEFTEWANAVHFEDEVHIEDGHEDLLTQFLFEVSTPELFEPVTPQLCRR
ncbi:hypothetical protein [Streptomyces sp. NPDC001985]|uniref:hypothetical protein n=1 Tax=Streptomyces sp. NPDC001985 TaxID=3154406 RepID=UPI0033235C96